MKTRMNKRTEPPVLYTVRLDRLQAHDVEVNARVAKLSPAQWIRSQIVLQLQGHGQLQELTERLMRLERDLTGHRIEALTQTRMIKKHLRRINKFFAQVRQVRVRPNHRE